MPADNRPRWVRHGNEWVSVAYPGWRIRDTGRQGRRDRYVIVYPDGTEDHDWHGAYRDKNPPMLNDAKQSAEAKAKYGIF